MPVIAIGMVQQPVCQKQIDTETKIQWIVDIGFDLTTELCEKFPERVVLGDMVCPERVVMVVHQFLFEVEMPGYVVFKCARQCGNGSVVAPGRDLFVQPADYGQRFPVLAIYFVDA